MKLLLDTHVLLWAAGQPERLPRAARALLNDPHNEPMFSSASLWEIAIKSGLGRNDFQVDARLLRRGLLDNGYGELPVTSEHAVAIDGLPPIHKDPFDRLLTSDPLVAQYPAPVRHV
jgi:PIN domain nuclease of toxin-antitoxin system